jgi:chromosome segregation ATPase
MTIDLEELAEWRAETDAHLARLDLVTEEHGQDLQAKRGADNKTLSASRQTQLDHGKKLDVIEVKLDNLGRGQEKLGRDTEAMQADMAMVKGRLSNVEGTLSNVEGRLSNVEGTLDEHTATLQEHTTQLSSLNAKVDLVQTGLGLLHEKLDDLIARS